MDIRIGIFRQRIDTESRFWTRVVLKLRDLKWNCQGFVAQVQGLVKDSYFFKEAQRTYGKSSFSKVLNVMNKIPKENIFNSYSP